MGLLVIHPGPAATVQDRGRPGHREFGVPEGGAFDRSSLALANALLGNGPNDAAVELTMAGGAFRATDRLALALAGAPIEARLEREVGAVPIPIPQSFTIEAGDRLVFGGSARGLRAYLAVRGGWRTSPILGSRSSEVRLGPGDMLPAMPGSVATRRPSEVAFPDPTDGPIRLIDGPDGPIPPSLLREAYRIDPASDRVGLRLIGPPIEGVDRPGRSSAPVAPGAVQVAGGRVLILGVAGGTMGGYPHVAHVVTADLDRLGQARPGAAVRFVRVELSEARRLDRERRTLLALRDHRIGLLARSGPGD